MKTKFSESIQLPEGVTCTLNEDTLKFSKGSKEVSRTFRLPNVNISMKENSIVFSSDRSSKRELKLIYSTIAHIKNMFAGLESDFIYTLETANVHFPMTLKQDGNKIVINNFLGEKKQRFAEIRPNVKVELSGNKITVSSSDIEAAGQTAANLEKATKISGRDRRIFQDGIYITSKPGDGE